MSLGSIITPLISFFDGSFDVDLKLLIHKKNKVSILFVEVYLYNCNSVAISSACNRQISKISEKPRKDFSPYSKAVK